MIDRLPDLGQRQPRLDAADRRVGSEPLLRDIPSSLRTSRARSWSIQIVCTMRNIQLSKRVPSWN